MIRPEVVDVVQPDGLWLPQVILKQMAVIEDEALNKALMKKMAPPLVTLLSGEPEIQYVALRNISLIVQQFPQILSHEVKARPPSCRAKAPLCGYAAQILSHGNHSLIIFEKGLLLTVNINAAEPQDPCS